MATKYSKNLLRLLFLYGLKVIYFTVQYIEQYCTLTELGKRFRKYTIVTWVTPVFRIRIPDTDPDPAFWRNADPDSDPDPVRIRIRILVKFN
jgi:hypothetical protein